MAILSHLSNVPGTVASRTCVEMVLRRSQIGLGVRGMVTPRRSQCMFDFMRLLLVVVTVLILGCAHRRGPKMTNEQAYAAARCEGATIAEVDRRLGSRGVPITVRGDGYFQTDYTDIGRGL